MIIMSIKWYPIKKISAKSIARNFEIKFLFMVDIIKTPFDFKLD